MAELKSARVSRRRRELVALAINVLVVLAAVTGAVLGGRTARIALLLTALAFTVPFYPTWRGQLRGSGPN